MKHKTYNVQRSNRFLRFVFTLFLWVTCYILYVQVVAAQQAALTLSPSLTELVIQPGKIAKQKYILVNKGDPLLVKLDIVPFEPKDSNGGIILREQADSPIVFQISDSEIILGESFFLKNNEPMEFELIIKSLERAVEQDYYYTLLAQSDSPKAEEETASVRAKITLGSNLLITVNTDSSIEIKPKLAFFGVTPRFSFNFLARQINLFDSFDKIPVRLLVDNKGKNLISPQGSLKVKGFLGRTSTFEIKPQNVLAHSQKELIIEALPLTGFFLGNHQLAASINFGEGTPSLFSNTTFIALPMKLVLILATLAFLAFFLRRKFMRDY